MDFLKIISEGRVDEFKQKYSQKFGKENVDKIADEVPQKYLDWVGKHLDVVNFDGQFNQLVQALKKFEKTSTNFPITDLYQYKSISEFMDAVKTYENRQRRDIKRMEGGNVVYDDGRYFIVNPLTQQASCYYGKGTKWCTSADGNAHFERYNQDGKLFYILDRNLPTDDPHYKVALLRKFDGDKSYWDAKDDTIKKGWILNSSVLKKMDAAIEDYLKEEFSEQLRQYAEKEAQELERRRLEKLRIQRIQQERRDDAEERRLDNLWSLDDPDCPDEGLKAHALLQYLEHNDGIEVMTNSDRGEIARIQNEIQRLQDEYDNDEEPRRDLLDEISDLENELDELTNKIDVYNIVPTGRYYYTTEFVVIDHPELEGQEYAVGDEDEMQRSAYESTEQFIDDIGYNGFNKGFVENHIDEEAVIRYAEDLFEDDVRDNPESYIGDDERLLSPEQENEIERLNHKIHQTDMLIERLEGDMDEDNEEEVQEKIDELKEMIEEINSEIEDIESDPQGDYPEELIQDAIDVRVNDVRFDIKGFMDEWGLDIEYYIDKDGLIEDLINTDGYGNVLNHYDGTADEYTVKNETYYVMRIN